jgi:hypothetical protein
MKYSIEPGDEFLHVTVSGRESDEAPSDLCRMVLAESARLGRPRILIELDQAAPLSPVSQYQLVSRLPELGLSAEQRIALVHRREEHQRANQYIDTVGETRGVAVRNFPNAEAAKDWLRNSGTEPELR